MDELLNEQLLKDLDEKGLITDREKELVYHARNIGKIDDANFILRSKKFVYNYEQKDKNKMNCKENDIVENLKVYPESHDEDVPIIYNYIDCLVCGAIQVNTDSFGDLDEIDGGGCNHFLDKNVTCINCKSEFKLVEGEWYGSNKVKIVKIKIKEGEK